MLAVKPGHIRMEKDRLFVSLIKHTLQFVTAGCNAGKVFFDLRGRNAILDGFNDILPRLGDLDQLSFGG
ncbi:hypothetical protein [Novosphingobium endophyticum]|uniref:hypothetical protein n=1 Tax=Novosphingobium endophyticum TaxID=1955250 RepID=UPI001E32F618|nr:hypothetical protein [Novosphingobium endophyticum]